MSLLPGRDSEIVRTPLGKSVRFAAGSIWKHPWTTQASWNGGTKQWMATVKAGFVNGHAPIVRLTEAQISQQGAYGIASAISANSGAFDIAQAAKIASGTYTKNPDGTYNVPLYDSPAFPLSFRNIGFDDASAQEAVPQFFANLGVNPAPKQPTQQDILNGAAIAPSTTPPPGNRLLRAADVVLHQPRSALTSQVSLEAGIATGISNVTQTLSLRLADPNDRLKVYSTAQFQGLQAASIDPLTGDYEEPNFDEILIATVFVVSPPNLAANSAPDQSWQAYVRHNLFWDLNYAQPELKPLESDNLFGDLLTAINILGIGAGSFAISFTTASINDAFQNALNVVTSHSMAGTFWTPTGGGSDSVTPTLQVTPGPDGYGLDKDNRLQSQRITAAQTARAQKLDPSFPYRTQPFNLSLLS